MNTLERPARSSMIEQELPVVNIPKSRELFNGDINDAVIAVQRAVEAQGVAGFEIPKAWWDSMVGNHGTTEEILDRFDAAYPAFIAEQLGPQPTQMEQIEKSAKDRQFSEAFLSAAAINAAIRDFPEAREDETPIVAVFDKKAWTGKAPLN